MKALDTDVLGILLGNAAYISRLSSIPPDQQAIPIIVAEEILRGRLNVIRQAEAGKSKISIDLAYYLTFGLCIRA
jgi:predicted nucleic acid-binding protein